MSGASCIRIPDGPSTPSERDLRTMRRMVQRFCQGRCLPDRLPARNPGYRFRGDASKPRRLECVEVFPRSVGSESKSMANKFHHEALYRGPRATARLAEPTTDHLRAAVLGSQLATI